MVVCSEKTMPEILAEMFAELFAGEKADFFTRIGGKGLMHITTKDADGEIVCTVPLDTVLAEIL